MYIRLLGKTVSKASFATCSSVMKEDALSELRKSKFCGQFESPHYQSSGTADRCLLKEILCGM
jgi:hypothetical protein